MIIHPKLKENFNFQINLTDFCPVNCSHCYIKEEKRNNKSYISENDLEVILEKIYNYLKEKVYIKYVDIIIIGGEVLYLNEEYLRKISELLVKFQKKGEDLSNITFINYSLSTSLLKKNIEKIDFFFNIFDSFCVSWDYRLNRYKNIKYDIYEKNIKYIQEKYSTKELNINITVTNLILDNIDDVYNILMKYNFKNYHLSFYVPSNDINHEDIMLPKFEDTSNFFINFYEKFKTKNNFISPIDNSILSLKLNEPNENTVCEKLNLFSIDINGDVFLCPEKRGEEKKEDFISNVFDKSFSSIEKEPMYKKEKVNVLLTKDKICIDCEYKSNCLNGCSILRKYHNNQKECWGFKKTWEYSKNKIINEKELK